jgi:Na+-driven multidrug efflux pump
MRYLVIAVLILIIASLGSALRFMLRGNGGERMVKALTVRVALSVGLFLLLMLGYFLGLIPQTGL